MNNKNNLIFHQKSKSISNNLSLKDFIYNNNINTNYLQYNNNNDKFHLINEDNNKEKTISHKCGYNIDDIKQNILDLYYDNNSTFKNKIDYLNLQFYLETEKYLNCNKINDIIYSQKLQANLFIILFKQINILIEEIERLNKIILENKYQKDTILKRTIEINEKKQSTLIKDNLIQSLKKTNTNTEKKLLEALLHEDKLIKDNERLRKENETYKNLTIVFENELINNKKKISSSPIEKNFIKHIKTYSDYGFPSDSYLGDKYVGSLGKYDTINNENKSPLSDKKIITINSKKNKELYLNDKKQNNSNNKIKIKNKIKPKNNNIKINKINNSNHLVRNNTLTENIKISLNKPTLNNNKNNKRSQEHKNKKYINSKNKTKKDFSSSNKFTSNNNKNNINKNKIIINHNLGNNNSCNSKKAINSDKINKKKFIKSNNNNLKLNLNNINSTINVIVTEINNTSSIEKDKTKQKIGTKPGENYKKKRNMSDISFTEIPGNQFLNDEVNNSINNINRIRTQIINRAKKPDCKNKRFFSNNNSDENKGSNNENNSNQDNFTSNNNKNQKYH